MSLEGIQKVLQVGSLLGSFATRDSWLSYPTPSPPLAAEPSGMLMKTTVPSRSSFDQQGACLADRSRAHEPQEHRAGSESLFTCFWGFEGQTVRVAKKGKLPQGGPQGFCARGARERCAFWPFAVLTSPPAGRLRGACGAQSPGDQPPERTAAQLQGKPPSTHISYCSFSRQLCPHPGCAEPAKTPKFPGTDFKLYFKC